MRAESCPACHVPLMSLREATPWRCLGCKGEFNPEDEDEDEEEEKQQQQEEETIPTTTSIAAAVATAATAATAPMAQDGVGNGASLPATTAGGQEEEDEEEEMTEADLRCVESRRCVCLCGYGMVVVIIFRQFTRAPKGIKRRSTIRIITTKRPLPCTAHKHLRQDAGSDARAGAGPAGASGRVSGRRSGGHRGGDDGGAGRGGRERGHGGGGAGRQVQGCVGVYWAEAAAGGCRSLCCVLVDSA